MGQRCFVWDTTKVMTSIFVPCRLACDLSPRHTFSPFLWNIRVEKFSELFNRSARALLKSDAFQKQRKVENWKWTIRKLIRNDLHFHSKPFEFNVSKWNLSFLSPRPFSLPSFFWNNRRRRRKLMLHEHDS